MSTWLRPAPASVLALLTALVTALALAVGVSTPQPARAATLQVSGIDVSGWQHPGYYGYDRPGWVGDHDSIDWGRVAAAGHSFAIVKATESTTYTNPYFSSDTSRARAAGLVVGAYHYARPGKPIARSARQQARHYVRVAGTQQRMRTLPPVLDLETTGGLSKKQVGKWAKRWLDEVQNLTGRKPMIYSYDSFLRAEVGNLRSFAGYPLWLARYRSSPPPDVPGAWSSWAIWQHTSKGRVPGIQGDVDLNWFNGSMAELLELAQGKLPAGVAKSRLQKGERGRIAGRIDRAYAGATVTYRKKSKNGWRTKRSKRVRPDGTFAFHVRPKARTTHRYRVRLHSSSPFTRTRSRTLRVKVVKPHVSAKISKKRMRKGKSARVTGRADAFYAGRRVVLMKRSSSGWKKVRVKRIRKQGQYRFKVRPKARTKHTYRVHLDARKPYRAFDASRRLHVRVR